MNIENEYFNVYVRDDLTHLQFTKRNGKKVLIPTSKILLLEDKKITLVNGKKVRIKESMDFIKESICLL